LGKHQKQPLFTVSVDESDEFERKDNDPASDFPFLTFPSPDFDLDLGEFPCPDREFEESEGEEAYPERDFPSEFLTCSGVLPQSSEMGFSPFTSFARPLHSAVELEGFSWGLGFEEEGNVLRR